MEMCNIASWNSIYPRRGKTWHQGLVKTHSGASLTIVSPTVVRLYQ